MSSKRAKGQYYTQHSPFAHPAFTAWAARAGLAHTPYLEPFAGAGHIPALLAQDGWTSPWTGYDIEPAMPGVHARDTIAHYPSGHQIAITNPPYLARNSAARRKLPYPQAPYDDLYKIALDRMLAHTPYVAAIIPESFLQSGLFHARCTAIVSLTQRMFEETEHPVCLALFEPQSTALEVWMGALHVGPLDAITTLMPTTGTHFPWVFNDPHGPIGLFGVDSQAGPSIRFDHGHLIDPQSIKVSSRAITRIGAPFVAAKDIGPLLDHVNAHFLRYRHLTHDVLLTSFKGLRRDGLYRRRLDFAQARALLNTSWTHVQPSPSPLHGT